MTIAISKPDYHSLLSDISAIYETSRKQFNKILVEAYWQIGRRIAYEAEYGERFIPKLSDDMTAKYGHGFSVTNLKYMRQFYLAYPAIGHTCDQLGWSHYRVLASIKEKKVRDYYEQQAIKERWVVKDLKQKLLDDKVEREILNNGLKRLGAPGKSVSSARLKGAPGEPGLCRIVELKDMHGHKKRALDLGFRTYKVDIPGLAGRAPGEIVRLGGTPAGPRLTKVSAPKSDLYTYRALVERVVDGDTIVVDVELGLGIVANKRLRLRGIDAPEMSTKAGQMAKGFVERTLMGVDSIVIKTYGTDQWDRYLVDVFYTKMENRSLKLEKPNIRAVDPTSNFDPLSSVFLNQELLEQGLARPYIGKG